MLRFIKTKRVGKQLKALCNQSFFIDYNTEELGIVCTVTVINKILDAPVASITLLRGEEFMLGAIRAKFNDNKYKVIVR